MTLDEENAILAQAEEIKDRRAIRRKFTSAVVELRATSLSKLGATAEQPGFADNELVFAAVSRCTCGAGLAYPKDCSGGWRWDCSAILQGRALPARDPASVMHSPPYDFVMYNIESDCQPSAFGASTRPK